MNELTQMELAEVSGGFDLVARMPAPPPPPRPDDLVQQTPSSEMIVILTPIFL